MPCYNLLCQVIAVELDGLKSHHLGTIRISQISWRGQGIYLG